MVLLVMAYLLVCVIFSLKRLDRLQNGSILSLYPKKSKQLTLMFICKLFYHIVLGFCYNFYQIFGGLNSI